MVLLKVDCEGWPSLFPRVEPVSPAAPSESDKGVARFAATSDGAQVPHLVGYRPRA